ncbi:UNKNOWN [Stylonychia lemnae]|uniref:Uncharacterized protein n=1 Tax=Stylonychia lemnae TaxID=5949 RepID=A0A078AV62_STYLE|nr:UNKNOWN [Stylonychia lemnae]|eukprot:CDW86094.1 UNKNOWN [Stylonychia lemnae]
MSRVSQTSQEFPLFSNNRSPQSSPNRPQGKLCLPDCSSGVSKEFPTYFKNDHQLRSRISLDNPYIEEDFRDKTINNARRGSLQSDPLNPLATIRNHNQSYNKFDKDFKKENILKNTDRLLLKNLDKKFLSKFDFSKELAMPGGSQTDRAGGARNDRVQMSVDLVQSFNDFKLEENYKADKQNYIKLPQIPIKQYDCLRDKVEVIQPPDLEIEGYSKFRDKYFSMLQNQNKPFNKKLGLFTLFSDKTTGEKIMHKIYDQIKREGLKLKEFKKIQAQHEVQVLNLEQSTARALNDSNLSIETKIMKGSNSGKVLALPKNRIKYRYFKDGEIFEKKDDTLLRSSLDQLTLSKQLQKKGVLIAGNSAQNTQTINFNDLESITSYPAYNNVLPEVDKQTLIKTKSLSNLFKRGSLSSLHSSFKPSQVPAINDDRKIIIAQHLKYLKDNEKNLENLKNEINDFESRNLKYETQKFEKSPPLYSHARLLFEQEFREQENLKNYTMMKQGSNEDQMLSVGEMSINQRLMQTDAFKKFKNLEEVQEEKNET